MITVTAARKHYGDFAALDDVDLQDVIVAVLTEALAEEIAEVRRRGLVAGPDAPASPKKPSRKKGEGGG